MKVFLISNKKEWHIQLTRITFCELNVPNLKVTII